MVQYGILNEGELFVGRICKSRTCGDFKIISNINSRNIKIQFLDSGSLTISQSSHVRRGNVKDYYYPTVLGVGYIGEGIYKLSSPIGRKWNSMLTRCYSKDYHKEKPTYTSCEVSEEWQDLQEFGKWYEETYPNDGEDYELDKDFKILGNKLYSSHTCVWLPRKINSFFIRCNNPSAGVNFRNGKYIARVSSYSLGGSPWINLGSFDTKDQALFAYKRGKTKVASELINLYRDKLSEAVIHNILDNI